jgi:hypothetical protein
MTKPEEQGTAQACTLRPPLVTVQGGLHVGVTPVECVCVVWYSTLLHVMEDSLQGYSLVLISKFTASNCHQGNVVIHLLTFDHYLLLYILFTTMFQR